MALISARATIQSIEVLSLLTASYLYTLCQALDLRAMQAEIQAGVDSITRSQLSQFFDSYLSSEQLDRLFTTVSRAIDRTLETSSTMDAAPRMKKVAGAAITPIVEFASKHPELLPGLTKVAEFRTKVAAECLALVEERLSRNCSNANMVDPSEWSPLPRLRTPPLRLSHTRDHMFEY